MVNVKPVTLYDVAEYAGVSYQTVSRVVNQASHVSAKTREKVEAAMAELNYIPNRVAQQLAGKQSLLIGVATSSLALHAPSQIVAAIKSRADQLGASVVVSMVERSGVEACKAAVHNLLAQRVSGLIINYPLDDQDAMADIVTACLEQGDSSGILRSYHLRYLRADGPLYTRIAFTDAAQEDATLRAVVKMCLLVGAAALAVLLGCSYLLAGLAARPVARSLDQQRRFLSDASHELKTPLTVILSSADLLAESAPAEEQTYVENIRAESRRMKKLVEEMLTLFRAESVRRETAVSEVDLSDVVTGAALRFEPVVFESGRRLLYTIDEGLQVSGDRDALERLTGILLDNAVKYAPQGTDIRLTLTHQDRTACLAVENGGDPIPPEVAAHLFDRFYRADSSRTGTGFGLGLAIARAIVQNHRGNIICRSQEGLNRFSVTLPILRQKGAQ